MQNRQTALVLCALLACIPAVSAQEEWPEADTGKGDGFMVELALSMDTFKLTSAAFGSPEIRPSDAQNYVSTQFPISGKNFWTDSSLSLGYEGNSYGGSVSLTQAALEKNYFGNVRGWVRMGPVRVTLGNDIESVYADSLGADPGLRLYTGQETTIDTVTKRKVVSFLSVNPDNITADEGMLVEFSHKDLLLALAAGDFLSVPNFLGPVQGSNDYGQRPDRSFRFGGRAGYNLENLGKVNASYIFKRVNSPTMYGQKSAGSAEIVPVKPGAQTDDHLFGLYGSLKLPGNFDLTLGYVGELATILDKFYNAGVEVDTGYPVVLKNGLNLNARYALSNLVFRTDHSVSFWKDKDYEVFETNNTLMRNVNGDIKEQADRFAEIDHFVMWNGIGASCDFAERFSASVYLRNLCFNYSVSGATPAKKGDYTLFRDEISAEFSLTYKFSARAEAYVKLAVNDMITSRSEDLNGQSDMFINYVNHNSTLGKPTPVATSDSVFTVSIPIGFTLRFQ